MQVWVALTQSFTSAQQAFSLSHPPASARGHPPPPDTQLTTVELGLKHDKGLKRGDVTCDSGWALTKIISEPSAILGRYDPFIL